MRAKTESQIQSSMQNSVFLLAQFSEYQRVSPLTSTQKLLIRGDFTIAINQV